MKQKITLYIILLMFLLPALFSQEGGEWKWAHYISGNDGIGQDYYNKIINTAFDDEGNIYIYGMCGGNANLDGTIQFSDNQEVVTANVETILLAKFDTLGNMLWHKIVKSRSLPTIPKGMYLRDNKIHIAGNGMLSNSWYHDWIYYFDTLVTCSQLDEIPLTEQHLPFKCNSTWTFFATFDLEGNLLDDHFVEVLSRRDSIIGYERWGTSLCIEDKSSTPICIDNEGNTYIYTPICYYGNESDPITIIIDGDSNRVYDMYLPGSAASSSLIKNMMLYKFSANWELVFFKRLIDHTEGIATSWEIIGDSVNPSFIPYVNGISVDEENNMYISGYISLELCGAYYGDLNQYPVYFYWDSTHYTTIQDISSSHAVPFIIKYNTDGEVQWCNQIFTWVSPIDYEQTALATWFGNTIDNNSLYILGSGNYQRNGNALIYFDIEENFLQQSSLSHATIGFYAKYNIQTGNYVNHGIIPSINKSFVGIKPAVINNHIIALGVDHIGSYNRQLVKWKTDGTFMGAETFNLTNDSNLGSVIVNENGYLFADLQAFSPVTFGDIHLSCNQGHSNAVFALYHDPSFAIPYPEDDAGIETYQQDNTSFHVYPNPANSILHVVSSELPIREVRIVDAMGRELIRKTVNGMDCVLDVTSLPVGMYGVKIITENGDVIVKKVVRN